MRGGALKKSRAQEGALNAGRKDLLCMYFPSFQDKIAQSAEGGKFSALQLEIEALFFFLFRGN